MFEILLAWLAGVWFGGAVCVLGIDYQARARGHMGVDHPWSHTFYVVVWWPGFIYRGIMRSR
jgi:hypothetical protein